MGGRSKWEYFREIFRRYRGASRQEKGRILEEFCRVCGYNRKYAIRKLSGPPPGSKPRVRRRGVRGPHYGSRVVSILRGVWEAAGYPWSVRLKVMVPLWMPWIRRHFRVSPEMERQLLSISARQMDRRLGKSKRHLKRRFYGRTKPGTLLKHHIPIRTDNWDVTVPGFGEVDLVSHSGSSGDGRFAYSLNFTDIHTAWVETEAILGKGSQTVREALEEIRERLPFPLRGIDSDNGSEFINDCLWTYCKDLKIQFTRGRPYKKDDNAHIEQKNWTHVRKLLGYVRYDTPAAVAAIHALYRQELRLLQNLFLPSVKLRRKTRVGARVRRHYDAPQTPLDRVRACPEADPSRVAELVALRTRLDPFTLAQTIDRKLEQIFALSTPARPASPTAAADGGPGAPPRKRRRAGRRFELHRSPTTNWPPFPSVTSPMAR